MVATAIHYVTGLVIARLFNYKDNHKFLQGLWAAAPDVDAIFFIVLILANRMFGMGSSSQWTVLFSHRGISHSFLLIAIVLVVLFLLKSKKILMVACMLSSHLILDLMTSWKLFLLLPFSYFPLSLNVIEVFDSVLVLLTTLIFAIFIGKGILNKERKLSLVLAYVFFAIFGFASSVAMGEFNIQTILLSQSLFFIIIFGFFKASQHKQGTRKVIEKKAYKAMLTVSFIAIGYLTLLVAGKFMYMPSTGASFTDLEPLEQFAFNYNAHTFEIDQGDSYAIGIVSLQGIQETATVKKVIDTGGVDDTVIQSFLDAYPYSIAINWINNPVWTFYIEDGQTYARIKYAKTYLENPHMPGPRNGMRVTLQDGLLVSGRW